jgi:hypothetical protein
MNLLCQFCDVAKVAIDLQEDLTKLSYMLNMKVKVAKHPSYFLATYFNHV